MAADTVRLWPSFETARAKEARAPQDEAFRCVDMIRASETLDEYPVCCALSLRASQRSAAMRLEGEDGPGRPILRDASTREGTTSLREVRSFVHL
jgi:hypothetical protein